MVATFLFLLSLPRVCVFLYALGWNSAVQDTEQRKIVQPHRDTNYIREVSYNYSQITRCFSPFEMRLRYRLDQQN